MLFDPSVIRMLGSVSPEFLIEVAVKNGWVNHGTMNGRAILRTADDSVEAQVPLDRAFRDFEPALSRAIRLVVAETRDSRAILEALLSGYEPVHHWFELSYAQYLTIPRSVLQSMPTEWQVRLVACLEDLDAAITWRPAEGRYWVRLKDGKGRFVRDPLMDYERGRRRVTLRKASEP